MTLFGEMTLSGEMTFSFLVWYKSYTISSRNDILGRNDVIWQNDFIWQNRFWLPDNVILPNNVISNIHTFHGYVHFSNNLLSSLLPLNNNCRNELRSFIFIIHRHSCIYCKAINICMNNYFIFYGAARNNEKGLTCFQSFVLYVPIRPLASFYWSINFETTTENKMIHEGVVLHRIINLLYVLVFCV